MTAQSQAVPKRQLPRSQPRRSPPSLRTTLLQLRQRMLGIGAFSSICWGIVGFLGVLVAAMWADVVLDLPPLVRFGTWFLSLAALAAICCKLFWSVWKESDDAHLARRLDLAAGGGGQIRSGLDLCYSGNMTQFSHSPIGEGNTLSRGLGTIAIKRARWVAGRVPGHTVIPGKPLLRSLFVLCGTCFFLLVLGISFHRMAWAEINRFAAPWGDHPAYSRFQFNVTPKNPEVLYGESLEISVEIDGPPVEQLELILVRPQEERQGSVEEAEPLDVLPMFSNSVGVWHASIANVTQPFDFYLRVRRARSEVHHVTVITMPVIREVDVVITPPLYTGLAPYHGKMPVVGIEGLPGTTVRVTAHSNRPLSGGSMRITAADKTAAVALEPQSDPRSVAGEFTVTASGQLELQIVDEDGQSSSESYSTPVQLLEDEHPFVRLLQPRAVSLATPTAMLPIVIAAEDDYGLRKMELFRSLNDSRFLPTEIELPSGVPRRVEEKTVLPLAEYGLQPGDEIKLFARVEDNDPHGPDAPIGKGAETAVATVRIISQQQFEQMQQRRAGMQMLMSKYQQAQRRLEKVADEIEQLQKELAEQPKDSPVADEIRQKLKQLAKNMEQEAEALRKLSESKLPLQLDKDLSPKLREMAERLQKLSKQMKQAAENEKLTREQLDQMLQEQREQLQQEQQQHQKESMEALEALQQVLPLKQAESAFVLLVQRQRQLAERLASLKEFEGADDPAKKARIREFEEAQRRIRGDLADLLDQIEEKANNLPEDERYDKLRSSALKFVKDVRNSGADEAMVDAEEALAQFSGSRGHAAAERAAEILEQFLSQCQGMGNQAGQCLPSFCPGLGKSLQQTLNQLAPGMQPGMNSGAGSKTGPNMGLGAGGMGGYSARADTQQNMGMYGGMPFLEPTESSTGQSSDTAQGAGTRPGALSDKVGEDGSGFKTRQTNPSFGGGEWGVPAQYRRQAGRYLQRLAEELGD